MLNRSFLFFEKQSHKNPRWVFAIVAVLSVLSLSQIPKIRGIISVYELLPSAFPSLAELKRTDSSFNDGRYLTAHVLPEKPLTEKSMCQIRRWISNEVVKSGQVTRAFSIFDLRHVRENDQKVIYVRDLNLNCDTPGDQTISLEKYQDTPWSGSLVDPKRGSFVIQFEFNDSVVDQRLRAFSYPILKDFIERWTKEVGNPLSLKTQFLGSAPYESYLSKGNKDFSKVHLLLLLTILILFRLFLGTWRSGILYIISLLIALVWVLGLMGYFGGSFDILSNSLIVLIAVSTMQDLTFVAMDRMNRGRTSRESFRRLQLAGFFTSFTTIVGFGSLAISSLPMIRDFGIWCASGAFFEWLLTFYFLPLLVRPGSKFEHWVCYDKAVGYKFLQKIKMISNSRLLKFHFVAVFALLLPWGLHFYDEPKLIFPDSHVFRADTDSFIRQFGWEYSVSLVFTDPDYDRQSLLESLQKNPFVQKIDTAQAAFDFTAGSINSMTRKMVETEFFKIWRPERYFGKGSDERYHLFLKTSEISNVLELRDEIHKMCQNHCYMSGAIVTYAEFVRHLAETLFESLFVSLILVMIILALLAVTLNFPRPSLVLYSAIWGPAMLLIVIMLFKVPMNMMTSLTASVVLGLTGDNIIEFMFAKNTSKFQEGMDLRFPGALVTNLMMSGACLVFLAAPFDPPRTLGLLFCLGFLLILIGDYFVLRFLWQKTIHRVKMP